MTLIVSCNKQCWMVLCWLYVLCVAHISCELEGGILPHFKVYSKENDLLFQFDPFLKEICRKGKGKND